MNRWVRLHIADEHADKLFTEEGRELRRKLEIPEGTKLVRRCVLMILEHPTFPETEEFKVLPDLDYLRVAGALRDA